MRRDEQRAALKGYGEKLGLAFQIADDLLDAEGDAARDGQSDGQRQRRRQSDARRHHRHRAKRAPQLAAAVANAERELRAFGDKAATLVEAAHFAASREH